MNNVYKISLIQKTYTTNNIGVPVPSEVKKPVFATKSSINQSEYYQSGMIGLQPYACYAVRMTEYSGEDEIEDGTERLTIYRTYNRTDGRIELYATKRKGSK